MHSTCVRLVIEGNIPEILREKGGKDGVHIKDIAGTIGADEIKLGLSELLDRMDVSHRIDGFQ